MILGIAVMFQRHFSLSEFNPKIKYSKSEGKWHLADNTDFL